MEKLYTVSKNKTGIDCGSDHELLIVKFRIKLKKVGKTTRPFRYDLNQIAYEKQIQGTRSDRLPEELWIEVHNIVQEAGTKTILKKKKCKKSKWLPDEALQIAAKRREAKSK